MKTGFYLCLFCVLLLLACNRSQRLSYHDKENIRLEVKTMLNNYANAIRQSGLKAEFDYLDNSTDFFWVPPGYTAALSYDSVFAILNRNASLYKQINNTFDTLTIIPLSPHLASYTCQIHSAMTDSSNTTRRYKLIETGTVIKRKSGWKLLSGQTALLKQE